MPSRVHAQPIPSLADLPIPRPPCTCRPTPTCLSTPYPHQPVTAPDKPSLSGPSPNPSRRPIPGQHLRRPAPTPHRRTCPDRIPVHTEPRDSPARHTAYPSHADSPCPPLPWPSAVPTTLALPIRRLPFAAPPRQSTSDTHHALPDMPTRAPDLT